MTAYPNAEDYVRAVQHPDRVFALPVLRRVVFELHPLFGIPMPASGNAAVVFKADLDGTDTALRFFIREDASSRERYAALGQHFAARDLEDCVAHPTWVDDAIRVNGRTWPMVQMSWVDRRTLDAYVGHLAGTANVGALALLARTWREFVARLQAAEFAHGDLQHGNVLIDTASTLRLVDFDGSWIAAFHGGPPPHETGHPNYQRTGREWGRWMDTFPGLVIYTALLALSRRPESWVELHNGENVLFSAEDFTPPFQTRTWRFLAGLGDAEVDRVAERLRRACDPAWRAGDTLEALLDARPRVEIPAPPQPVAGAPFSGVDASGAEAAPWWELTAATAGGPVPSSGAAAAPTAPAPPPTGSTIPPTAPAPSLTGFTMPPPPPKAKPGPSPEEAPSFAGARPAAAWYPRSGPTWPPSTPRSQSRPAPRPAPRSRSGRSRSAGRIVLLVLVIAVLLALVIASLASSGH